MDSIIQYSWIQTKAKWGPSTDCFNHSDQTHLNLNDSWQKQTSQDYQQGADQKQEYGQCDGLVRDFGRTFFEL